MTVSAWTGDRRTAVAIATRWGLPQDRPQQWLDTVGCEGVWVAREGGALTGVLRAYRTPDDRLRLIFAGDEPASCAALAGAVNGACVTLVDAGLPEVQQALSGMGFSAVRRELLLEIPVTDRRLDPPEGVSIVSILDRDAEEVMRLDAVLREDIPGSSGWEPDLEQFLEQNHRSPGFDPKAYLIAIHNGAAVGLVRIWNRPDALPRVGMWGVLASHRQRGIASVLLASALAVWHRRGAKAVCTEIDESNTASRALAQSFGASVVGSTTEMARR